MGSVQTDRVAAILPAHNEEAGIALTIADVRRLAFACKIAVADNVSTDRTSEVVRGLGIEPLFVADKGKGHAVRAVLAVINADYVFMLDSDHTYPASYIPAMLNLLENDYEAVVGNRALVQPDAMSRMHRWGNRGLSALARTLYWHRIGDLCSGMWGFRGYVAKSLELTSPRFTLEAEIFAEVVGRGYKLAEIPIRYDVRKGGESHLKIRDGVEIAAFLIKRRFRG